MYPFYDWQVFHNRKSTLGQWCYRKVLTGILLKINVSIFRYKLNSALFACSTCFKKFFFLNYSQLFKFIKNFNSVISKNYITLSVNSVAKNKNFSFVIIYIKFPLVAKKLFYFLTHNIKYIIHYDVNANGGKCVLVAVNKKCLPWQLHMLYKAENIDWQC